MEKVLVELTNKFIDSKIPFLLLWENEHKYEASYFNESFIEIIDKNIRIGDSVNYIFSEADQMIPSFQQVIEAGKTITIAAINALADKIGPIKMYPVTNSKGQNLCACEFEPIKITDAKNNNAIFGTATIKIEKGFMHIQEISEELASMFGYGIEDIENLKKHDLLKLINENEREGFIKEVNKATLEGVYNNEHNIIHKHGYTKGMHIVASRTKKTNDYSLWESVYTPVSANNNMRKNLLDDDMAGVLFVNMKKNEILYSNKEAKKLINKISMKENINTAKSILMDIAQAAMENDNYIEDYYIEETENYISVSLRTTMWEGEEAHIVYFMENTKRVKAQSEQIKLHKQLKNLIKTAPSAICLFQREGEVIKPVVVGDGLVEILGRSREQIMQGTITDFNKLIHPEEFFIYTNELLKMLSETNKFHGIYRLYNVSLRSYKHVLIDAVCIPQGDGKQLINTCFTDVSKEQRLRSELIDVNEQINKINKHIPGAIFKCRVNIDWTLIFANDELFSFLGYTRDEFEMVHKNNLGNIMQEEDKKQLEKVAQLRQITHGRDPVCIEMRFITKSGDIKWVSLRGEIIEDDDAAYNAYFVFVDITEFKLVQKKQEAEHKSLDNLLTTMPCGVVWYDPNKETHINYYNEQAAKLLGFYDKQDMLKSESQKLIDFIHPDDRSLLFQADAEHTNQITLRFVTENGEIYWAQGSVFNHVKYDGNPGMYFVFVDITANKNQELAILNLMETMPCGAMWLEINSDPHILYANEFALNTFGFSNHEELKNSYRYRLLSYADEKHIEEISQLYTKDKQNLSLKILDRNGNEKWISGTAMKKKNSSGQLLIYFVFLDITEDRKNVILLKENEQRMRAILENAKLISWEYYPDTGIAKHNNELLASVGVPKVVKDFPQSLIDSGIFSDENATILSSIHKDMSSGIYKQSFILHSPLNMEKWYSFNYTPVLALNGETDYVLAVGFDVSDEKIASNRYKFLHDKIEDMSPDYLSCFVIDISNNRVDTIIDPKNMFENCCDMTLDEFGKCFNQHLTTDSNKENFKNYFERENLLEIYNNARVIEPFTIHMKLKDDKKIWLRTTARLIRNPENDSIYLFLYFSNVTNLYIMKKIIMNAAVKDYDSLAYINLNNGQFSVLHDDVITTKNVEDKGSCFFEILNNMDTSIEIAEYDSERIKELNTINNVKAYLEKNNKYTIYFDTRDENGQVRHKEQHYYYINKVEGDVLFAQSDITVVLEEKAKRNEEFIDALALTEQTIKDKYDLLYFLSHDIRTDLNTILSMSNLALSESNSRKHITESLETIISSGENISNTIDNAVELNTSGSEYNKVFNVLDTVNEIIEELNLSFKHKKQSISFVYKSKISYVFGSKKKFRRVIMNILENANKYSDSNEEIYFEINCTESKNENKVDISIILKELGMGINKEQVDQMNRLFGDLKSEYHEYEGLGISLSLVKSIVNSVGGNIVVSSEKNKYIQFDIIYPFNLPDGNIDTLEEKNKNKTNIVCDYSKLKGKHIILAEDNPMNVLVEKRLLNKIGIITDVAVNGEEAVEKFEKSKTDYYDCILMDLQMPIMDGYSAAIAVRQSEHKNAKDIPIIAMTANSFIEDIQRSIDVGMNAHIPKPIAPDKLYSMLFKYLIEK